MGDPIQQRIWAWGGCGVAFFENVFGTYYCTEPAGHGDTPHAGGTWGDQLLLKAEAESR